MTSPIILQSNRLNVLFEPKGNSNKIADIGIKENGVDISNLYMGAGIESHASTSLENAITLNSNSIGSYFTQFGTVKYSNISVSTHSTVHSTASGIAFAGWKFKSNGVISRLTGGLEIDVGQWIDNLSSFSQGSFFEVRAELIDGDAPLGTIGTYIDLSTDRLWELSVGGNSSRDCTLRFTVRSISNNTGNIFTDPTTFSISVFAGNP